jgi:DNA-binding NarL/FixJ family response regulator
VLVLTLVAEGRSNRGIAEYLCLVVKTVEKRHSIMTRNLDLYKTSALNAFAIERELVESDLGRAAVREV